MAKNEKFAPKKRREKRKDSALNECSGVKEEMDDLVVCVCSRVLSFSYPT
uniref:Uncharacterized protein n=1 Tax=Lotus japonicus TaxID=34305 RepID=I3T9G5_LOTJA|nr:unknown [Lotus japonicus]